MAGKRCLSDIHLGGLIVSPQFGVVHFRRGWRCE
jgi:hypothetical protein